MSKTKCHITEKKKNQKTNFTYMQSLFPVGSKKYFTWGNALY